MAVKFEVLASLDLIDTPLINLKGKKFTTVKLYCGDESFTFTTDPEVKDRCSFLGHYCSCYDEINLELHAEYLVWYTKGTQNMIPLHIIDWWVLE